MGTPNLSPGNYQTLTTYKKSIVIYDLTYDFCSRYLVAGDRTIDQMVQAARSCKQNIVEGCSASAGSTETEYRLICVARASLDELLEDYRDYLRTRQKSIWAVTDPRVVEIREFAKSGERSYRDYKTFIEGKGAVDEAEWLCNIGISLIYQESCLLDRQKEHLWVNFSQTGGVREKMLQSRLNARTVQKDNALSTLREVYRELSAIDRKDLMEKIASAAKNIKNL